MRDCNSKRLVRKLSELLRRSGHNNFHFASFTPDAHVLLPEIDLIIDYLNGHWYVYASERGVFTSMRVYSDYGQLEKAILNKNI